VTWHSDCDIPNRQWRDEGLRDAASWSFVIHELAWLPDAPHIDFSDDEVAVADVEFEFEPLSCWIASVVGHDEDAIEILDCFVRRHAKSMCRMIALMMIRKKTSMFFVLVVVLFFCFDKSPLQQERPQVGA
jgi:hypothetical protein